MLKPAPPPSASAPPSPAGSEQRLDLLFRHVLKTPEGQHLLKLMLQHRQGETP